MSEEKERVIRDIYHVVKALHEYNIRELRYWGKDQCCYCGYVKKEKYFILCEQCCSFWDSGNSFETESPLADIYFCLNDKTIKFPSLEEFRSKFYQKIEMALSNIGARTLGIRNREERDEERDKEISQLVFALRERIKQKLIDTQFVDDLVSSVAQRWNILEIS